MIRILLLLLLPLCSFGQHILLSGYLVDGATNQAIDNAKVRLYIGGETGELNTFTKADGYYEIQSQYKPIDKKYAFTIQKNGYQRINGIIQLNWGNGPLRNYKFYKSTRQPEEEPEPIAEVEEIAEETVARQDGPSLLGAPANNLIFLIDVSGSMGEENRLENLKASLNYLIQQYRKEDKISIITYSTFPKVLLKEGSVADIVAIERIIRNLRAGGQSKGTDGLQTAYDMALVNFKQGGNNKIILATDGFFGVDKRSRNTIQTLIENGFDQGVRLSIFAFGKKDKETEERLMNWCNAGAGNYTNITSVERAKTQVIKEARGR